MRSQKAMTVVRRMVSPFLDGLKTGLWIAGIFILAVPAPAQQVIRHFSAPEFYDPPNQRQKKTLISAEEAIPSGEDIVKIKGLKLEFYSMKGETEFVVEAPECVFDPKIHTVHSVGSLLIHSGDNKLQTRGRGFSLQKAGPDSVLIISNQVETVIQKSLLESKGGASVKSPASAGTNEDLVVRAEHLVFDRSANLITYTGNVRGEDEQLALECEVMNIQRSTNGGIERINAERSVAIIDKSTGGRATGDHAVYSVGGGAQQVELTGNPRWQDGGREATATLFQFDRGQHLLRAQGDAFLKLPRNALGESGNIFTPQPAADAGVSATNQFVQVYADSMLFELPATNAPAQVQRVTADRNVIIIDPSKNSRASGGHAEYSESSGVLELTENALWQSGQRVMRGDRLVFDRNNKSFAVRTNAYLKLPAASLARSLASSDARAVKGLASTNQFLQIVAGSYDYHDDVLVFRNEVRVGLVEEDSVLGTMTCDQLTVNVLSNEVRQITADGQVRARQLPRTNSHGGTTEKELNCDMLNIFMRPGGTLEKAMANGHLLGTQSEIQTNKAEPILSTFGAAEAEATFLPGTNRLDQAVAKGGVTISRDKSTARGEQLDYSGETDVAVLSGNPVLERPDSTTTADRIIWSHSKGAFLAQPNARIIVRLKQLRGASREREVPAAPPQDSRTRP